MRDDGLRLPGAVFFQRHELDEADDDALAAGELGEGLDLGVVESAQQHAVDLDRAQAGSLRGADAGEHALVAARHAGDAGEDLGVDRVHADGDAVQAGSLQRLGERLQQMAVGGQRDVERVAGLAGREVQCRRDRRRCAVWASSATISTRPERSSGSPPVRRTFSMPSETRIRTMRR